MGRFLRAVALAVTLGLSALPAAAGDAGPAFSWAGLYVGGFAGPGFGDAYHCDAADCNGGAPFFPTHKLDGATGGIEAGYNFQFGNIVAGVELDYAWSKMKGSSSDTRTFGCAGLCSGAINNFGTLRGRVGWSFDRFLPYFTVGVARTEIEGLIGVTTLGDKTSRYDSLVIGGGLEVALSDRLSVKAEYLHIDGPDNVLRYYPFCGGPGCGIRVSDFETVRFGLNLKLW